MVALEWQEELHDRLAALRARVGETVDIGEIETVVKMLLGELAGDVADGSGRDAHLRGELAGLVMLIRDARSEIVALSAAELNQAHIPDATDELDAIVKATEQATHGIMDAAEKIDHLAGEGEAGPRGEISQQVTRIYEACTFQDITGQRIGKVVSALKQIERTVAKLARSYGVETAPAETEGGDKKAPSEEDLLNGPQLPEDAKRQAEIDELFSSLD